MNIQILNALVCLLFLSLNVEGKKITRYQYPNIIDISQTPLGRSHQTQLFCDAGSWIGFSYDKECRQDGFRGPYSIQNRYWFAQNICNVSTVSNNHDNKAKIIYYPGELEMEKNKITQSLIFVNDQVALLKIENDTKCALKLESKRINSQAKLTISNHEVIIRHSSGEGLVIRLPDQVQLKKIENNYTAILPASIHECFIAIAFYYDKQLKSAEDAAYQVLLAPTKVQLENKLRWQGYLDKIVRNELSNDYNRIAVKSIVTLISNWKNARGGLLHQGIIPSHAVNYFIGFWAWDCFRFSVALASFDPQLAEDNVRAIFDYQQRDGMVIDCIYVNTKENNARNSKPPLGSWAVNEIFEHNRDTAFLKEMYPKLLKYYQWWYKKRDHDKNGICEYGSCDGTIEAAAWESGMDNAIRFDKVHMLKNGHNAWSIDQESVDLNCYLGYEYTLLNKFARILKINFNLPDYRSKIANYFFDNKKGFFFDRRITNHSFVEEFGCEGYLPFWTHIATSRQFQLAKKLLEDPNKFSTYIPFPTIAADNPKYDPNGYWRGPIWLDQTYYGIMAFRNYGLNMKADNYTQQVFDRLKGLKGNAPIYENYNTHTGKGLQSSNFSWSAAHLLLLYNKYKRIQ